MRAVAAALILVGVAACAPQKNIYGGGGLDCGKPFCVTSPYVAAKGGPLMVGGYIDAVITEMGGAPTSAVNVGSGVMAMTWTRTQNATGGGIIACSETMMVKDGRVTSYSANGNC